MAPLSKLPRKELEHELRSYLSRHDEFFGEAYDFNIKVGAIAIPNEVYQHRTQEQVSDIVQGEMEVRLRNFAETLREDFPWIEDWGQVGRSGGWLVLKPQLGVMDESGDIPHLGDARKRLKDLRKIYRLVQEGVRKLEGDMRSIGFFIPGPLHSRKAWDPRESP